MPIDRRSFLDEILAAGALMGLMDTDASAQRQGKTTTPPPGTHDSLTFWN